MLFKLVLSEITRLGRENSTQGKILTSVFYIAFKQDLKFFLQGIVQLQGLDKAMICPKSKTSPKIIIYFQCNSSIKGSFEESMGNGLMFLAEFYAERQTFGGLRDLFGIDLKRWFSTEWNGRIRFYSRGRRPCFLKLLQVMISGHGFFP